MNKKQGRLKRRRRGRRREGKGEEEKAMITTKNIKVEDKVVGECV